MQGELKVLYSGQYIGLYFKHSSIAHTVLDQQRGIAPTFLYSSITAFFALFCISSLQNSKMANNSEISSSIFLAAAHPAMLYYDIHI